jgi:hypothetical protein
MKNKIIFITLTAIYYFSFTSCKKEAADNSQAANVNLLVKTVTKYNQNNAVATSNFTYNPNGQLTRHMYNYSDNSNNSGANTETFYRNNQGRLDSTTLFATGTGSAALSTATHFYYDNAGKVVLSISIDPIGGQPTRDSSVYLYSGSVLQKRTDYRSFNGAAYFLLRDITYQFDISGNLLTAVFAWTTHTDIQTISFLYDNKVNSLPVLPVDGSVFLWAPVFYSDYKPGNNPIMANVPNGSSYTTEYTYTANNKPLYSKSTYTGSSSFFETWFYYD